VQRKNTRVREMAGSWESMVGHGGEARDRESVYRDSFHGDDSGEGESLGRERVRRVCDKFEGRPSESAKWLSFLVLSFFFFGEYFGFGWFCASLGLGLSSALIFHGPQLCCLGFGY
jgi:hypothetical protein